MPKFRYLVLTGVIYNFVVMMWVLVGISSMQIGYFRVSPVETVIPTNTLTLTLTLTSSPSPTFTSSPTLTPTNTNTPTQAPIDIREIISTPTFAEEPTSTAKPSDTVTPKPKLKATATKKAKVKPTSEYPSDITAVCNDGSYSYSKHASGTCSRHGGVKLWVNKP